MIAIFTFDEQAGLAAPLSTQQFVDGLQYTAFRKCHEAVADFSTATTVDAAGPAGMHVGGDHARDA